MRIEEVVERARKIVTPSSEIEKKVQEVASKVYSRTLLACRSYPQVRDAILGGSYAKGTWLERSLDIDIFVRFHEDVSEEEFEKLGLEIGSIVAGRRKKGKKYAEHPYTEIFYDGVRVNIVPCYFVEKGKWKSAADRSVYHLELVKKEFNDEMRTEARLLKSFMQAIDVYGAEIEKEGFSGYASEVIILKNKTFVNSLKYFSGLESFEIELKDPVDPERDLSRAISKKNIAKMILYSRWFLERPDLAYFDSPKTRKNEDLSGMLYVLVFSHRIESDDILWGKLKKAARKLVSYLERLGFRFARYHSCASERQCAIILLPLNDEIPKVELKLGPFAYMKENTEKFLQANKKYSLLTWISNDGRINSLFERKNFTLRDAILELLRKRINIGIPEELESGFYESSSLMHASRSLLKKDWLRKGIERTISDEVIDC